MPHVSRVALITGCGKPIGIGNSTARALAAKGVVGPQREIVGAIEIELAAIEMRQKATRFLPPPRSTKTASRTS